MTIRIANKCNQYCLHCMQESGPKETVMMPLETFKNTLDFINNTVTKIINISGGESTLHPEILTFLELACKTGKGIVLLTNGDYLINNPELRHNIFCLMVKYKNLFIQVTSIKNVYTNFTHENDFVKVLKPLLIYKKVRERVGFINKLENGIVPIGRALENINKLPVDSIRDSQAPRCFNLYNVLQHFNGNLIGAINHTKMYSGTSLCIPLIVENGDMIFGEYGNICSVVWNVNNEDKDPILKVSELQGPCGSCYVSKTQEKNVNQHLSVYTNKHNKIEKSYLYKKESEK